MTPPKAARHTRTFRIHGDERKDDYDWLRDKTSPEVLQYLSDENAYAEKLLEPTRSLSERIYREMLSHIKETDLSVPYPEGDYLYYSRTEKGRQYPIRCRKKGLPESAEQIILDQNVLAEGHEFLGVGAFQVSDDGRHLAYSTDPTGYRRYTLHIRDLQTGRDLPDSAEDVGSVAWAADARTVFYTTKDHAKRPYRLYRHELGSSADELVLEESDELYRIAVGRTRSGRLLVVYSESLTTTEARILEANRPLGPWRMVSERLPGREYEVDHHGERLYLRVNDTGRNFRLVSAPLADLSESAWREVVPERKDVMIEGIEFFARHYVLLEREAGLPQIRVTDISSGESHRLSFPEEAYSVFASTNKQWDTDAFRFEYQSPITPESIFEYDMAARTRALLKRTEIPGGFDPSRYEVERLHAAAPDGALVPVTLVSRKGLPADGTAPLLLTGYGSYGYSYPVTFSSARLSLLDRGVRIGIAHVRGGGEMGKPWHDQGRMMSKMNTFNDFVAAAECLISRKLTRSDRLAIQGGSAGGLLVGAVTNMRPDLFKAVLSHVPFVDVINTMLDDDLPLTVGEYEEWGNPNKKEEYEYMKRYCPYTNIEAKAYPAMLVKTSLNDSQVMYWEPAKYVARLRALKTDGNQLLLVTNMGGGHGGSSGRYDKLRETAQDYAFLLSQFGITE